MAQTQSIIIVTFFCDVIDLVKFKFDQTETEAVSHEISH